MVVAPYESTIGIKQRKQPIGVMDSGLGGLSIWKHLKELLPDESLLYVGDHAYLPYSGRSTDEIQKRVTDILTFFSNTQCKLVVIACNTATVAGIEYYRKRVYAFPIIGVVPVIKTAAEVSKKRRFAVLSTEYTAKSTYQRNLIRKFASDCKVANVGCPNLVGAVEQGDISSRKVTDELRQILVPLRSSGVDMLVLGCTHYFFLKPRIEEIIGPEVSILDSSGAVSRHARKILETNGIRSVEKNHEPVYTFLTTGDAPRVSHVATRLLGEHVVFTKMTL